MCSPTLAGWILRSLCPGCARSTTRAIICVAADIGQGAEELAGVRAKALASGAEECYVEDLREEFVRDFIFPTLRAGAIYNRKYLLGTSMARPLIAKRQVEMARAVGADALAHGCTGKGNDQVRFELTYMAFAPDLPVIAPWREWDIRSREDAIAYAAARNIPVAATKEKIYSRDRNLWHISHEGGILEDPAQGAAEGRVHAQHGSAGCAERRPRMSSSGSSPALLSR